MHLGVRYLFIRSLLDSDLTACINVCVASLPPWYLNPWTLLFFLRRLQCFPSSHTFSTFPSQRLMAQQSPPIPLPSCRHLDFLAAAFPSLSLATACWIKHRCSRSQQNCRLHQIRLLLSYPITDGSSNLIQDLSRTNVTPCYSLKQMGPRSGVTDTAALCVRVNPMSFHQGLLFFLFWRRWKCEWLKRKENYKFKIKKVSSHTMYIDERFKSEV